MKADRKDLRTGVFDGCQHLFDGFPSSYLDPHAVLFAKFPAYDLASSGDELLAPRERWRYNAVLA